MAETIHLQLLLATFAGWVSRQQARAITYLMGWSQLRIDELLPDAWAADHPEPAPAA